MKLAVSEGEIGSLVASMDQFKADGVFSPQVYKSVLSSAGYTPGYFKQVLHDDMLVNQLRSGLAGSDFATPAELALTAKVVAEQRDVRYVTIPQEKFISAAPVKDEEVATYYTDHQAEFRTLESVDLDYIELSLAEFIQPAEERAVLEAFEIAKESFQFQARTGQGRDESGIFIDDGLLIRTFSRRFDIIRSHQADNPFTTSHGRQALGGLEEARHVTKAFRCCRIRDHTGSGGRPMRWFFLSPIFDGDRKYLRGLFCHRR